ncbi:MAG: CopG family transcriptional regulator [Methanocellales archaeon]|nr:CopG family transcriptional regulator [Methanocellales archaeon]
MKTPERITVAMDEDDFKLFKKTREELGLSQSELVREALRFYSKHRVLFESIEDLKLYTHAEMLGRGEHVIMDIDHWLLFLKFIETHPDKDEFWELNKAICEAHADQFKHKYLHVEPVLRRLEACNLFTLTQTSKREFTLVLSSDILKEFVKMLLQETLRGMGFNVDIKEDLAKLRLKVSECQQ